MITPTSKEVLLSDSKWKSDMDLKVSELVVKVDRLIRFLDSYEDGLRMVIAQEASRAALRKAVIEKSITALIWASLAGMGVLIWNGVTTALRAWK